jgi:predicted permease
MRFYRALLRLYPAAFRDEYRDELCRAFEARAREFSGPLAPIARVLTALVDVIPNAIAAHGEIFQQDLGYAARTMRGAPGFALTAVLVVALAVGANTAVFSIADFVFVRPLPFAHAEQLVKLWQGDTKGTSYSEVSPLNLRDWREQSSSFSAMAAYWNRAANLVGTGDPRRLETVRATPELLPMMGVRPRLGRVFTVDDLAAGECAVLSDGLWRSYFGSDPSVIGSVIRLDGIPHTVVGVMPASFQFPSRTVEAWTSLALHDDDYVDRGDCYLQVVGRLRPRTTVARAREDMAIVSARLAQQYPKENHDVRTLVMGLREEGSARARQLVLALCGAALCILVLACANLASLFLARGAYRARELAVRAALGAGRERLVRQLVTECVAIALVGGIVGIAIAVVGVPLLARLVPNTLPIEQAALDLRVLALAVVCVLLTSVVFGMAPAMQAGKTRALDALRGGARSGGQTQRIRAALVAVEVATSVVLLITSGLLIRAVWRIQSTDPGFVPENVVTLRTALPLPKYLMTARRTHYYDRVLDQVRATPGVRSAAFVTGLPIAMRGGIWSVTVPGQTVDDGDDGASVRYVTPQFFSTLGIPLMRGRDVTMQDTRQQPLVAVVSESFVKHFWPKEDPIGRSFTIVNAEHTVVGVVGDVRVRGREMQSEPQVYLSYQQVADSSIIGYTPKDLVVRTAGPTSAGALLSHVRSIVRSADAEQPISDVRTLSDVMAEETAPRVIQLRLLVGLALIALLIAGLGIHGLLMFAVSKRTQELGVRMALGAQAGAIIRLVLREGLMLTGIGIAIGVVVAVAAGRGMSALLFGVSASDPLAFGAAAVLCLVTAVVGCIRPALEAARVHPLVAMRTE